LLRPNSVGAVFLLAALACACEQVSGQAPNTDQQATPPQPAQSNPPGRPTVHQTVVVSANYTPEEKEDGDINEVYQRVFVIQRMKKCDQAIEQYQSVVIPMAERAKFEVPRNKFLFLSYRGIADCYLSQKRYLEAEEKYQKLFEYMAVWPGKDDSDFPINYRSIGMAGMHREDWKAAEEPLQKAVAIFDEQIEKAAHSEVDFIRTEHCNFLRSSQDITLKLLAADYFREGRSVEALALLERAYEQAIKYNAPSSVVEGIVKDGLSISLASGDVIAGLNWTRRSLALK